MPIQINPHLTLETGNPDRTIVWRMDQFSSMLQFLEASTVTVFDFETSGLDWFKGAHACGIALAGIAGGDHVRSFYVPFRHDTYFRQLAFEQIRDPLGKLLADEARLKIGHNLKFDLHFARKCGWDVRGPLYDTMIAANFKDENRPLGLKDRAHADLGSSESQSWEDRVRAEVRDLAKRSSLGLSEYMARYGYSQVSLPVVGTYACLDVESTARLFMLYEKHGLSRVFSRVWATEMELVGVLCEMEANGMPIDVSYLQRLRAELQGELQRLEAIIWSLLAGRKFNLASDDHMRDFLTKGLNIALQKRTKGGKLAVDAEVLEECQHVHPVIQHILRWREAEKIANTYTASILTRLDVQDCLHPDYQQVGTATGRLCVAGNTVLETSVGDIRIVDLDLSSPIHRNACIFTHRGRWRPILAKYYKGREQMYRVETADGCAITCTAGHRFLTPRGWRKLSEVVVGDEVCKGEVWQDVYVDARSEAKGSRWAALGIVGGRFSGFGFGAAVDPRRDAG